MNYVSIKYKLKTLSHLTKYFKCKGIKMEQWSTLQPIVSIQWLLQSYALDSKKNSNIVRTNIICIIVKLLIF